MERRPAERVRVPEYPNVSDIERDRRGFLRLFGQILEGVVAMGPLARMAWADDDPTPRMKGDVKAPEPPELGGKIAVPEEPVITRTGGVPRPPDPPEPAGLCVPGDEDCEDDGDKPVPRLGGVKRPPDPPVEIRKGGEMPAPAPPTRSN